MITRIGDLTALELPADGPPLGAERDALDLVGEALGHGAELVVIPAERLSDDFFRLRTQVAGNFVQKLVNYGLRLAIVGDVDRHLSASEALRDYVREANRGRTVWFVPDRAALEQLLATRR